MRSRPTFIMITRLLPLLPRLLLLSFAMIATRAPGAPVLSTVVDRFGFFETAVTATGSYGNPYLDVTADATLTAPDGSARPLPLFWDGGNTWRLRFSPDQVGTWRWTVRSPDAGLNVARGSFECRPSLRRGSIVPMAGAPHHFQYQNGERMWFMGDTAWSFVTDVPAEKHDDAAVARYLERRGRQGFNIIHTMMLSETGDGNAGGVPFSPLADEKLNPAYWQAIDRRVAFANSQGIVMGLAIAWGRKIANSQPTVEPYAWGRFPSQQSRLRYARYIAARYSAYDVYFLVSGEWHGEIRTRAPATGVELRDEFIAIGNALRAADPHRRMTGIHPMSQDGSVREFNGAPWMDFGDYQQNYRFLHERIFTSRQYAKPVVNSEYAYHLRDQDGDGQPDKENSLDEHDIRHASWDICMAGGYLVTGFGTTYFGGNRDPGPFDPAAEKNVVWETQIQHLKRFFTGLEYWKLIGADHQFTAETPRSGHRTQPVTRADGRVRNVERPAVTVYWAMQIPGQTYILYTRGLQTPATLMIDGVGGPFTARLFDPRTGAWKELDSPHFAEQVDQAQIAAVGGPSSYAPGGHHSLRLGNRYTFTPPDEQDWVVLLQRR